VLDDQSWWILQAGLAAVCALVFLRSLFRPLPSPRFSAYEIEARTVLLAGLVVIAFANVATSYATATANEELRNAGGMTVRAVLLVMTLYLLAWRRRPR
jgi:hypothetical protein